jgi:hypothetical protein
VRGACVFIGLQFDKYSTVSAGCCVLLTSNVVPHLILSSTLPAAELKLMERVSKYKDIAAQGEGKVKDYIAKRRKKNAAKDHRFVPYERR